MAEYSVEVCKALEGQFRKVGLSRPMRTGRYDAGDELTYEVTDVTGQNKGQVQLVIEKFVGGGFAGQVYKVKVTEIKAESGPIGQLKAGCEYAMKILVPPSTFSRLFRNFLYWAGFQGAFQLQVNPAAARAGAIWQKFIRRGAKVRFGDENSVVDIHAIFVDERLGSCGELSEWIDGRTWQLEVDDRLDLLKRWRRGKVVDEQQLGSAEYRAKKQFMKEFVQLLHDMGAHEFARQYEWSTCKSQPNCLKRRDNGDGPSAGLVAVDFRAGLALLPFLPMSPGDFKLIGKGLLRGSIVQFDRGDLTKLERFVQRHKDIFSDMGPMLEELKAAEKIYRNSIPDITHNDVRLLYDMRLWARILESTPAGWKVKNLIDEEHEQKLRANKILTLILSVVGFLPFLGKSILRFAGHGQWRRHYLNIFTNFGYLKQAVRGKIIEKVIVWHRQGRVNDTKATKLAASLGRFLCHLPFSILPAGLHRFLTDFGYAKQRLAYLFVRPIRLYFNAKLREQWLGEMVTNGKKKHILSNEDAKIILSQINEPFIQKYLKSLAVHVCTLPVTQIVSVLLAAIYIWIHPEMPRAQSWGIGLGIIALFQVVPISPGSLVRGFYVLYLVIRERNFKDYNIAVFLGFFKYIGYLAFPIQMAYHYPALARFMAGHWATEATHIVPVFGERGALLEHWVFCLFYNWPLTIRRRMRKRTQLRKSIEPRYWHVGVCAIAAVIVLAIADLFYPTAAGGLQSLKEIWWLAILVPLACGAVVTLAAGGTALGKRIVSAAICGIAVGLLNPVISAMLNHSSTIAMGTIISACVWEGFIFAILSTIGAVITELKLPEPKLD